MKKHLIHLIALTLLVVAPAFGQTATTTTTTTAAMPDTLGTVVQLTSATDVNAGDTVRVTLAEGELFCDVRRPEPRT